MPNYFRIKNIPSKQHDFLIAYLVRANSEKDAIKKVIELNKTVPEYNNINTYKCYKSRLQNPDEKFKTHLMPYNSQSTKDIILTDCISFYWSDRNVKGD